MKHSWQATDLRLGRCSCGWPFRVGQVRHYTWQKHVSGIKNDLASANEYLKKMVDRSRPTDDVVGE